MAKEFSFADLNKEMSKHSTYGETLDKSTISEIDHYIPTGNFNLNACLTGSLFGGYPNNRAVALASLKLPFLRTLVFIKLIDEFLLNC